MDKKYILSIDSGSTGIRAILFNKQGEIVGREYEKTPADHPAPGAIEHDPEIMWQALLTVVNHVFSSSRISPNEVAAVGISNQRASFSIWDKKTGKPLIKFINWADVRAANTVDAMNNNPQWKMLKKIANVLSNFSPNGLMTVTKMLNFTTAHAVCRLKWILDEKPELKAKCISGEAMFGTLDTWYIYRLTGGKVHITDSTNAISTGLYNPFQLQWNDTVCKLFGIPMNIFPKVIPNNGEFGIIESSLFEGSAIPIRGAMGDQQAALFGHCCFKKGEGKISQGSGAFVDINVGETRMLSKRGLFPIIAWNISGKHTWMLESFVSTVGTLIDWLGQGIGLSDTPKVLNELAAQCNDAEGVIFIPSHAGILYPYFNSRVRGTIFGLSLNTHRCHVARGVFEGIAMSIIDNLEGIELDTGVKIQTIKVDGGVSKSDILLQILSNYSNISVNRAPEPDMTATGAAYMAGLGCGFWKDLDELQSLTKGYTVFTPKIDVQTREQKRQRWKRAVQAILSIE